MHDGIDNRDHYRLNDDIDVTCKVVRRSDTEQSNAADHFKLSGAFSILRDLYQLELEAQDILRNIGDTDREMGSFLHNLNRRVEVLGRAMIAGEVVNPEAPASVRISEGGISFVTTELFHVGTHLAMKLLFKPGFLGLTEFGEVRHCRLAHDGEDYIVGVRFVNLDPVSQKLISRHIIRRQSEERRARLRHDRHS